MDLVKKIESVDLFEGFTPSSQPLFWIGTGNQFIGLHNDPFRNIIALFSGQKRIVLFPPEELPNIYPAPFDKRSGGVISSLVDAFNPDLKKFPFFKKTLERVKVAVIKPGEFLYLPPLWWHAVEGKGFNVGLNCWFYDDGKINKLKNLSTPAESLMVSINLASVSNHTKNKLYKKFIETIETNTELLKCGSYHEFKTVKTAQKIRCLINYASLSNEQRNLWKQWVNTFALWYVFSLKGNPFPTLSPNEFKDMLKRYRKNKRKKIFNSIKRKVLTFLFNKKRETKAKIENEKHGIVPY